MKNLDLTIEGMHCQKCVERVKGALAKLPGVTPETVDVGRARLHYDEAASNEAAIVQAIDKVGYKAQPQ